MAKGRLKTEGMSNFCGAVQFSDDLLFQLGNETGSGTMD